MRALTENNPPNKTQKVSRFINFYLLDYMSKMVKIDKEKCIGCGACESACGKVFKLVGGKAEVTDANSKEKCVKEAKDICPVDAISV